LTEKHHREDRIFLLLSVFIGIFSGLAIVCFRYAIDWCRIHLLGSGMHLSPWRLILAPTLTGLLVSLLVIYVFPSAKGNGVNQIKGALFIYNGYMPLRAAVGKFITCALAIGSGQSLLGPEDPSLLIGASIASALGRLLRLSRAGCA
jgi:CIC family chloride channel protein